MPTLQGQTYDVAKFSDKAHEIEKKNGRGGGKQGAPRCVKMNEFGPGKSARP